MHDLLLFGQIPASRHEQLTQILAGLTALPEPKPILERRYIFKPTRAPTRNVEQLGGSQNVTDSHKAARKQKAAEESRYCTLIEDLTGIDQSNGDGGDKSKALDSVAPSLGRSGRTRFSLHMTEVPEAEVKSVMSQGSSTVEIDQSDPIASVEAQGLRCVQQYGIDGLQFVFNNIVIRLQRCMKLVPIKLQADPGPRGHVSEFNMKPWDKSGGYIIQASVTLTDGKNQELLNRGTEQLRRLKEDLKGCVELRTVDRLSMDPRIR